MEPVSKAENPANRGKERNKSAEWIEERKKRNWEDEDERGVLQKQIVTFPTEKLDIRKISSTTLQIDKSFEFSSFYLGGPIQR